MIRYFCVLLVCKGIICILSFLKVNFVFEPNKVCHCNMLCLIIERTKGIVWEYMQSAVCMACLLYCTLVYKFTHYKQSSAPLEHTHTAYCVFMWSKSCKLMTEIDFPSLNKDDIVEENPLGDFVPHVITHNYRSRKIPWGVEVVMVDCSYVHFFFCWLSCLLAQQNQ